MYRFDFYKTQNKIDEWVQNWIHTVHLDQITLNIFQNFSTPSIGRKFDDVVFEGVI